MLSLNVAVLSLLPSRRCAISHVILSFTRVSSTADHGRCVHVKRSCIQHISKLNSNVSPMMNIVPFSLPFFLFDFVYIPDIYRGGDAGCDSYGKGERVPSVASTG